MIDEVRKWEVQARLRNKREAERAPLLAHAGLVPTYTPEQCRERRERYVKAAIESRQRMLADSAVLAAKLRAKVAPALSPDVILAMEDYIARTFPPDPVFACCFWRRECLDRGIDPEDSSP